MILHLEHLGHSRDGEVWRCLSMDESGHNLYRNYAICEHRPDGACGGVTVFRDDEEARAYAAQILSQEKPTR